jgi:hypothetical protein
MSQEAMEAVLANSKATLPLRGILLALAWKTYDNTPPFKGPFTVRYIAMLANVKHRQAQTHIATLRKLGELVITGKQGREYVYGVNVPLANYAVSDVDNYAVSDVVDDEHDANYAVSDVDNYAVSDVDNYAVSDVVTTQYPAFGSYKETRNKNNNGVTSHPASANRVDALAEQTAEQTPTPPPPSPASDVWRRMRDDLRSEMTPQQFDTWLTGVRASWLADGTLQLLTRSRYTAEMLATRYSERVVLAAEAAAGRALDIEIRSVTEVRRGATTAAT